MRSASLSASARSWVVIRTVTSKSSDTRAQQVVEVPAGLGIQTSGGFVEEQQFRPSDQTDGDIEPSPLPTGQAPNLLVGLAGQTHRGQQIVHIPRPRRPEGC